MNKKILYITHLSGKRVNRLWLTAINAANEVGLEVHLACNMRECDKDKWVEDCEKYHIITHQIDFNRNPFSSENIKAKKQLQELMDKEKFDIVHCNTPIGGVLGRICANKAKVPYTIYQAHGFHFWKGAPWKNWIIYYTVEKYLAKYTDCLITINKEDYQAAKKFRLKKDGEVIYIPGVGVDIEHFHEFETDKNQKRLELGISEDATVFISVGELNYNKNHIATIKAFNQLKKSDDNYYLICGEGELRLNLEKFIKESKMQQQVKILGFRDDILQLLQIADVFVFPSIREGLSVSLMEAMAAGLPCTVSRIRGNTDLITTNDLLFNPLNVDEIVTCMEIILDKKRQKEESIKNKAVIEKFSTEIVQQQLKSVYLKK